MSSWHNEIPMFYYVAKRDWAKADYYRNRIPETKTTKTQILKLIQDCGLLSTADSPQSMLSKKNLSNLTLKDIESYVNGRAWHDSVKAAYLPRDILETCPLVSP